MIFGIIFVCVYSDGIDFLVQQTGLRPGAFVAMEAVRWLVETVEGVASRQDATRLLQEMLKENLIAHASGDPAIPFLDGYFFYYMPHRELQKGIGATLEYMCTIHTQLL